MIAALHVEDVWELDRKAEAKAVFGTTNIEHPGVAYAIQKSWSHLIGGRIEGIHLPVHYDFRTLRLTPIELRSLPPRSQSHGVLPSFALRSALGQMPCFPGDRIPFGSSASLRRS